MEPEDQGKIADHAGIEVSDHDGEASTAIRWIDDTPRSDDESNDDDAYGNGEASSAQLELGEPELITTSGGIPRDITHEISPVGAHHASGEFDARDDDDRDDDDWDDDDWDDEDPVATDRPARTAAGPFEYLPEHLTLVEVLRVRSARIIGIVAVVTIVAVLMATVLLWQRVEDTRAEVDRSRQVTSVPGLAEVHRRLNRIETQIAAILGSPNGDPTGRADAIQRQIAALNQCVADFQHAVVSGTGSAVRYC